MSLHEQIANIIEGADLEHSIDALVLDEGLFDGVRKFFKSRSLASRMAKIGMFAGTGYVAYRLYKNIGASAADPNNCESGIKSFVVFLLNEVYKLAVRKGVNDAVDLGRKLAKETTGSAEIGDIVARLLRPALNELLRRANADDSDIPTQKEILDAAERAVEHLLPPDSVASANLENRRRYIEGRGVTPRHGRGKTKGAPAWKIYLDRLYSWGSKRKLPLCFLILMHTGDSGGGAGEELSGLNEKILQDEFIRVLHHKYPVFRI